MFNLAITCLLLAAALGLSLRRFSLPYLAKGEIGEQSSPVTMVASAVFLAALALAVSDRGLWYAAVAIGGSLLVALVFDQDNPRMTAALSVACLLSYVALR